MVYLYCTVESLQQTDQSHPGGEAGACRSFCARPPPGGVALPYASTTIVCPGGSRVGGVATVSSPALGGCIPNPAAYMIQPNTTLSSDSFQRPDVTTDRRNDSATYHQSTHRYIHIVRVSTALDRQYICILLMIYGMKLYVHCHGGLTDHPGRPKLHLGYGPLVSCAAYLSM